MIQLQVFCIKICLHHQSFLIGAPYRKKNPGSAPDKRIQLKRKKIEKKKKWEKGGKYQNFTRKVHNWYAVSGPPYCSVVDRPGKGHRDPTPPLFLNQNEAWRPKNGDPPPPPTFYLGVWMTGSPSPHLRVWIQHCCSLPWVLHGFLPSAWLKIEFAKIESEK